MGVGRPAKDEDQLRINKVLGLPRDMRKSIVLLQEVFLAKHCLADGVPAFGDSWNVGEECQCNLCC